jgi:multiple antibiotic resistance protein
MNAFLVSFTALFVALDIVGVLPLYLSLTKDVEAEERKRIVNVSMLVALVLAVVFLLIGRPLFRHLGISIPDFKIAGGLILLLISLADLLGGPESHQKSSGSTGIVPLAVPLITGPAILTTLILQVDHFGYVVTVTSLLLNYFVAWLFLRNSHLVTRILGKDGTVVLSKIAALLLVAISVSMIRGGVFELLETLKK